MSRGDLFRKALRAAAVSMYKRRQGREYAPFGSLENQEFAGRRSAYSPSGTREVEGTKERDITPSGGVESLKARGGLSMRSSICSTGRDFDIKTRHVRAEKVRPHGSWTSVHH